MMRSYISLFLICVSQRRERDWRNSQRYIAAMSYIGKKMMLVSTLTNTSK